MGTGVFRRRWQPYRRTHPRVRRMGWYYAPTPPTAGALTLASSSSAGPVLSWVDATGGTAPLVYDLHRSTTPDFTPSGTSSGSGTCLAANTTSPYTDGTAAADTTYYYLVRVRDAAAQTADSNYKVGSVWADPVVLLVTGDSIMAGFALSAGEDPGTQIGLALKAIHKPRATTVVNESVSGSHSFQWIQGETFYEDAVVAANAAGCTHALIRVGLNDSGITPTDYKSYVLDQVTGLFADVPTLQKVYLGYPTYTTYGSGLEALMATFRPKLDELATATVVVIGKAAARRWGEVPSELQGDQLHPTAVGARWLGESDAYEIAADLDGIGTGGGGSGPVPMIGSPLIRSLQ